MITYETYCQIRLLNDQRKLTATQIAAELQLDIKTVEKWISQETFVELTRFDGHLGEAGRMGVV